MVVRFIFSSILQIWYVKLRVSRSISDSPLDFEITRVDCISILSDREPCLIWSYPDRMAFLSCCVSYVPFCGKQLFFVVVFFESHILIHCSKSTDIFLTIPQKCMLWAPIRSGYCQGQIKTKICKLHRPRSNCPYRSSLIIVFTVILSILFRHNKQTL